MATRDSGGGQQHTNRQADEVEEVAAEGNEASDLKERHEKLS
ncbi:ubiquitin-like protein Pup, partial [Frankia sp. CpI1-P]